MRERCVGDGGHARYRGARDRRGPGAGWAAGRLTIAGTVAAARLEQLRAAPCASGASGTAVTRGIEERWTAAALGPPGQPSALRVELSVTYRVRGFRSGDPARTQRFTGAVP